MRRLAITAAAVLLVAGCSAGGDDDAPDRDAWAADLAPLVADVNQVDFDALAEVWDDMCQGSDLTLAGFVAAALDNGTSPQVLRVSARHGCPDRAGEVDRLLATSR